MQYGTNRSVTDCLQVECECIGFNADLGMIDIESLKADFRELDLLGNRLGESSFVEAVAKIKLLTERKW